LILEKTPFWAQAIFFGALLSAILSTASGTLLAPSSLFTENVLRPLIPSLTDKNMLWVMRTVLVFFAIAATAQAVTSNSTMYQMVQGAYSVTLVGALVPLALGIYWKRATTQGAMCAILAGMSVWGWCLFMYGEEALVPPQLCGLGASLIGMLVGSLVPQFIRDLTREPEAVE
jgi:Na+/proline symporter